MKFSHLSHALVRPALAAALLAAFPLTSANSAVSPEPTIAVSAPLITPGATPVPEVLTKLSPALQAQHLANLKTRGDAEITRRLTNLNTASSKITGLTTLSATDKTALTTQVEAEVTGLSALKTKLDADTTLADARADVQSIVTEYRVYLLMLPKVQLVSAADRLTTAATELTAVAVKLQTAITAQKTAGKDVTAMEASLTDMQAKNTAAQTALSGVTTKLLALQPSDYNADHTVLMQYRTTLGAAQTDLKASRADAASIVAALSGSTAPSPSASASAGATASPAAK